MSIEQVITALALVMKQNTSQFGDIYWQQIRGVSTGTPTACSVANIYISEIEKDVIQKYNKIAIYCRLIDNGTSVWIGNDTQTSAQQAARWKNLKKDLNAASTLK